jgi:hypothetical protein
MWTGVKLSKERGAKEKEGITISFPSTKGAQKGGFRIPPSRFSEKVVEH